MVYYSRDPQRSVEHITPNIQTYNGSMEHELSLKVGVVLLVQFV
jgi:hypothetical protein